LGDTSPVQWYSCAKQQGNTIKQPVSGAIMVLEGNSPRKMPTGHPVYVEAVRKNGSTTWELRISHTNFDRQCRLDLDSTVVFDEQRMTASFHSGPWACWARDLKVLGFIVR
jgi:surface antigen